VCARAGAIDLAGRRLPAAGFGDVAQHHRFLDAAFKGQILASDLAEAARRALDAGLPWIARIEARRGRFLDASEPACRAALVASAVALGLGATARAEADGKIDLPPTVPATDDEKAKAADALLAEGALGRRLVWRVEAGSSVARDGVPLAIGRGLLAFGNTAGAVAVVPVHTAEKHHASFSTSRGLPKSVAVSWPFVAAVSARGDFVLWRISERDMMEASEGKTGDYAAVTASTEEGKFVLAGKDGRLYVVSGADDLRPVQPRSVSTDPIVSVAVLSDSSVLVARTKSADRVDLVSGAVTPIASADRPIAVAPYGAEVLVARGTEWEVRGRDGAVRAARKAADLIVGIAGDRAAGMAYLAFADGVAAFDVETGALRWSEAVEASGNPVLGGGLLVVPAGRGAADGRRDRTLTALRLGMPGFDPFDEATRAKVLAIALAAAREGRVPVAGLLLEPVFDLLSDEQREEAERALAPEPPATAPEAAEPDEGR
jgi:hypothetical protein